MTAIPIYVGLPVVSLNGVSVYAFNLVRGLCSLGWDAHLLITHPDRKVRKPLPLPTDIPTKVLYAGRTSWPGRWRRFMALLERNAPCVYIPNHDVWYSCVNSAVADEVLVIEVVHCDDPVSYADIARAGRFLNAIVAVSEHVAAFVRGQHPEFGDRVTVIPTGVPIPPVMPLKPPSSVLRIIYAGRLDQKQKRIHDLVQIARLLRERRVDFRMTLYGSGPEAEPLRQAFGPLIGEGRVQMPGIVENECVLQALADSDVCILVSNYEGLPVILLEAMARSCVPVVSDVQSGIPQLIRDGDNGYRLAIGDVVGFADRLTALASQPDLRRRMAERAYARIAGGPYSVAGMARGYAELIGQCLRAVHSGEFCREHTPIVPPPEVDLSWKGRLRTLLTGD